MTPRLKVRSFVGIAFVAAACFATLSTAARAQKSGEAESPLAGLTGGIEYRDIGPENEILTGLEVAVSYKYSSEREPLTHIIAIRPIYGSTPGAWSSCYNSYQSVEKLTKIRAEARPGFAVGAISVKVGKRLQGVRLTFVSRTEKGLDASQSYQSRWIGGHGAGPETTLGDGRPAVGMVGRIDQTFAGIGLIYDRAAGLNLIPKVTPRTADEIAAIVERAGGRVIRDETKAGRPIVEADFSGMTSLSDVELEALAAAESLHTLSVFSSSGYHVVDGWRYLAAMQNLEKFSAKSNSGVSDRTVSYLRALPKLKTIDVGFTNVTDVGMAAIGEIASLERLWIHGLKITDASAPHVGKLKNLQLISLNGTGMTDDGIAVIRELPNLREVQLFSARVTDAALAHVAELKSLEGLMLGGPMFTPAGLRRLTKLKGLQRLHVYGRAFNDEVAETLGEFTELNELMLNATLFTDEGLTFFEKLTKLERLQILRMGITGDGLRHLRTETPLKTASFADTELRDEGLEHLARCTTLTLVDASRTRVTSRGVKALAPITEMNTAKFAKAAVGDDAMSTVAGWKKLKHLDLIGTDVTSAGVNALNGLQLEGIGLDQTAVDDEIAATLASFRSLQEVYLFRTAITDATVKQLATLPELRTLNLGGTRLTDAAAPALAALPKLDKLILSGTGITDASMELLRSAPSLRDLYIEGTLVSKASLPHIGAMPKLRHLHMTQTKIDYQAMKKWRPQAPAVEIYHGGGGATFRQK